VGKKLYGKNYRSRDYFNRIHLYYGGSKSCDHWHQGPGFVTSHVTFSLMFEMSLQSVNPSITLPYWDFTLESTFYTPSTFRESGVFSADWFGDASCNNSVREEIVKICLLACCAYVYVLCFMCLCYACIYCICLCVVVVYIYVCFMHMHIYTHTRTHTINHTHTHTQTHTGTYTSRGQIFFRACDAKRI